MTNVVGYARVPPGERHPGAQQAQLRAAGAARVYVDHAQSSRAQDRPQWLACLESLRPGDTLLVAALDRIAGSEVMAIATLHELAGRQINIKSLTEPVIDTTTPAGQALFAITAVLAGLRASAIADNTRRGLAHARAQGRIGGRPSVMTPERTATAVQMRQTGHSITAIAKALGVGASSVSRALAKNETTGPPSPPDEAAPEVILAGALDRLPTDARPLPTVEVNDQLLTR